MQPSTALSPASSSAPKQFPLGSGYGASTTSDEVMRGIDLRGRTALVTGGYSGLGRETVRCLALAGAQVVVPARDVDRARRQLDDVAGLPGIHLRPMDLLEPGAIDAFAAAFTTQFASLDILVLNAAVMALPTLQRDARGQELQFATNHLGHFQLTARLWPALQQAGRAQGARVVAIASRGHRFSPVVFDDPSFSARPYDRWAAYGQSKTANILFARALDARGADAGVRAFAVHPGGIVETNLAVHVSAAELQAMGGLDDQGRPVVDPERGLKSVAQGAATQLWCATSPRLAGLGGLYCEDCDVATVVDAPAAAQERSASGLGDGGVRSYAVDGEAAERLWRLSETLTGVQLSAAA